MDTEFQLVFRNLVWENAWVVVEQGSRLLTTEFLCTLQLGDNEVDFRMFNKCFTVSWKNLSKMLGFADNCSLDIDAALHDFDRTRV
jgi:hypothetical protein